MKHYLLERMASPAAKYDVRPSTRLQGVDDVRPVQRHGVQTGFALQNWSEGLKCEGKRSAIFEQSEWNIVFLPSMSTTSLCHVQRRKWTWSLSLSPNCPCPKNFKIYFSILTTSFTILSYSAQTASEWLWMNKCTLSEETTIPHSVLDVTRPEIESGSPAP